MSKYIIRKVEPEACDFSFYFDDDGLTERGGDFFNNLFIVPSRETRGFNAETYKGIQNEIAGLIEDFKTTEEWRAGGAKESYKRVMELYGIDYNPRRCHLLKEFVKYADESEPESVAEYLSIVTGKEWKVSGVCGYSQGDYVELVYCPDRYKNGVKQYGKVWLGCAKEFCVAELDENGEEIDSCYGYIVADCEARSDEDYKRIVSEWAGIDESQTTLEMIDGYKMQYVYTYRAA